jgi:hypothetical protein
MASNAPCAHCQDNNRPAKTPIPQGNYYLSSAEQLDFLHLNGRQMAVADIINRTDSVMIPLGRLPPLYDKAGCRML